jgi:hypothetical protein
LHFQNWEKLANIWLVLEIQTVMPVGYSILLLSAKQSRENQCNGASRFKKNSALSILFEMRSPLQIEFATFAPKNHNLFVKFGLKKGFG